jgi:hypothetical protein
VKSYSDNLKSEKDIVRGRTRRQVVFLPTNSTPSLAPTNSLTIPAATRSFLQPGGPDSSRMCPLVSPPPKIVSTGTHPVENMRAREDMDAADWVKGHSVAEVLFNAENRASEADGGMLSSNAHSVSHGMLR